VGTGSRTHNVFTLGKILLIVGFIVAGLARADLSRVAAEAEAPVGAALRSPNFPVQLLFVSFAYSGWNTALYLAGEFRRPDRDIPRAVLLGTVAVAILYAGLNVVFLASSPISELVRKENIGRVAHVAAVSLFGPGAGQFISLLIAVGLISAASANIMAGPRVYEAMGADYPSLRVLARRRAGGGPVIAIGMQIVLAATMMLTSSFDALISYVGMTLALFTGATVLGVIVFRRREPEFPRPYRTWGYPVTPVLFLLVESWMIFAAAQRTPLTAAVSAGTLVLGLILYAALRPRSRT
jgi:basic amino acid/polyamine antiporter, APA family